MPIPALLSIAIESVNLGGAMLQRLSAELESDSEHLDIRALDFRAPGVTQVHLSGKLAPATSGIGFTGSSSIESNDPRALVAWLVDRSDAQSIASGVVRLVGDVSLSHEAVRVEHFNLDLDRMNVAGSFGYVWESDDRPARLDAALTAPDIDVENWPKDVIAGHDPQLERAVQEAMRMFREHPVDRATKEPPPPTWGVRQKPR